VDETPVLHGVPALQKPPAAQAPVVL